MWRAPRARSVGLVLTAPRLSAVQTVARPLILIMETLYILNVSIDDALPLGGILDKMDTALAKTRCIPRQKGPRPLLMAGHALDISSAVVVACGNTPNEAPSCPRAVRVVIPPLRLAPPFAVRLSRETTSASPWTAPTQSAEHAPLSARRRASGRRGTAAGRVKECLRVLTSS